MSVKSVLKGAGDTMLINGASEMMQFAVFILIGVAVLPVAFSGINNAFGLMLPAGFVGGHGTAAAIGGVLGDAGWADASTIGQTFATVGLLGGILLGVVLINFGARKGWTKVIRGINELPEEMLTGVVPEGKAASLGRSTTNGVSIDSLTWHACLVLVSVGMAYLVNEGLKIVMPGISFPTYGLALLCGVVVQLVLKAVKLDSSVDKDVITHIGSSATDFLVVFGIASIKVSVVVQYWVPIVVLSVLGFLFVTAWLLLVSRRFFCDYWFEHGILYLRHVYWRSCYGRHLAAYYRSRVPNGCAAGLRAGVDCSFSDGCAAGGICSGVCASGAGCRFFGDVDRGIRRGANSL